MRKAQRICRWVVILVGVWASCGLSGHKTTKNQPLPFDPAVSLFIAVEGNFVRFPQQEEQHLVLYPTVTAYLPDEPHQELESELSPEEWAERMVQAFTSQQLPEGWAFFSPNYGQLLRLHVVIYDTLHRLFKAVVKAWDGTVLGELTASSDRGEIVGSLDYAPDHDLLVLDIWQGGGAASMMAKGVVRTPKAETGIVLSHTVGFVPEPDDPTDISNPLLAFLGTAARTYNHTQSFPDNDSKDVRFERPSGVWQNLRVKTYLTEIFQYANLPPDKQVADQINKLREQFISSFTPPVNKATLALADAKIPPFSRNVQASWTPTVWGITMGIVMIPVFAKDRIKWVPQFGFELTRQTRGRLSILWSGQIKAQLTQEKKRELQIGDPLPVDDLYALEILRTWPTIQAQCIMQPVTISVQPDKVCGPLSGGVRIAVEGVQPDIGLYRACVKHGVDVPLNTWCDAGEHSPQDHQQLQLPPPSYPSPPTQAMLDTAGTVTVELPKGFRYKFTAGLKPTYPPCTYDILPTEQVHNVPSETQVVFDAQLRNVGLLKVYVYPPTPPQSVRVEVYRRLPSGDWALQYSGFASYDQNTGAYLATFGNLPLVKQPDGSYAGSYRIRAIIIVPPQPPIERQQEITFTPTCEQIVSFN